MGLSAMPLFAALGEKMQWHQVRQGILAENVANAETPGYRARDIEQFSVSEASGRSSVQLTTTRAGHLAAVGSAGDGRWSTARDEGFEVTPNGNGVSLEDEMMKVTANQMDYQTAATLYTRSMRLIRTALGRQA
ncbi:flagellar basal-body rod protein FlgB [Devosia enhydra]|uniref:Flagellar basal body rod protein FlgB n=1 Tax=Devosia enhydra TaxID=665118 RepID=A0A1K2HTR6_9HYPH|nr:flagellar basal body rod protein FlgB [Devosia enhydra]SFZ81447.1 flagellar basal-body rod protein FlgB [Devosia enhydra]